MKVVLQTSSPTVSNREAPVIGLDPPKTTSSQEESSAKFSGKSVKIALKTNPTAAESETIDRYFPIFDTGTPEEWILWLRNWETIHKGLNLTTAASWVGMIRQLLAGDALRVFDATLSGYHSVSMLRVKFALKEIAEKEVFPKKALVRQKRFLRYGVRKTLEWTVRRFSARLHELNSMLAQFPGADSTSVLDDDELKESLVRAMPNLWKKCLARDHELDEMSWDEAVAVLERMEFADDMYGEQIAGNGNKRGRNADSSRNGEQQKPDSKLEKGQNRKRKGGNSQGSTNGEGCPLHGPNCGHSQGDCKVLKAMADKERERYRSRTTVQRQYDSEQHRNKKQQERNELHSILKDVAKQYKFKKQKLAEGESHMVEPSQVRESDQIESQTISDTLDEILGEHE